MSSALGPCALVAQWGVTIWTANNCDIRYVAVLGRLLSLLIVVVHRPTQPSISRVPTSDGKARRSSGCQLVWNTEWLWRCVQCDVYIDGVYCGTMRTKNAHVTTLWQFFVRNFAHLLGSLKCPNWTVTALLSCIEYMRGRLLLPMIAVSVCQSVWHVAQLGFTVQKRLNRSWWCLGWTLLGAHGTLR